MLSIKVIASGHRAEGRIMETGSGRQIKSYSAVSTPLPLQHELLLFVQVKICLSITGDIQSSSTSILPWENIYAVIVPPKTKVLANTSVLHIIWLG